ncbi:MAG: hypothetical protein KKE30_07670, partial [Gammaproteobacteria bacterium]|nr:hypothetical protein [Gammaproteobacteria bacterium]MBU1553158.1 hypothetical protein [Gammaproteobacteria bacterium]
MPALTACWTRPDKTPIIISMRTLFSYLLFVTLALSGLTGSVQSAHAYTLADALNQQSSQHGADTTAKMPCHSTKTAAVAPPEHDCCDQPKHQCKDDCCAKQCATSSALLATELFRYIRPDNTVAQQNLR